MVISYNCKKGITMGITMALNNGYNYEWLFDNGYNIL